MTVPVRRIEPAVLYVLFTGVTPKPATHCLTLHTPLSQEKLTLPIVFV